MNYLDLEIFGSQIQENFALKERIMQLEFELRTANIDNQHLRFEIELLRNQINKER